MVKDEKGYPRDQGSVDFLDSCRLAGVLAVVEHPEAVDLRPYVAEGPRRHPDVPDSVLPFSRDQLVPLAAGLIKQRGMYNLSWYRPTNGDILLPSVRGLLEMTAGRKARWYHKAWLYLEILYSAYIDPLAESNQLVCMLDAYGPWWLKQWTKHNDQWELSLLRYWCQEPGAWRGECALAQHITSYISKKVQK